MDEKLRTQVGEVGGVGGVTTKVGGEGGSRKQYLSGHR